MRDDPGGHPPLRSDNDSPAARDGAFALPLAWRLAGRELRGGVKGFRLFLACLLLGVAAIAAVGSVAAAFQAGLARDGRAILGGDVMLRLRYQPATPEQRAWLTGHADRVATQTDLRAMARRADDSERSVVELKAVDDAYPLYGRLQLSPDQPLSGLLAVRDGLPGTAIEPSLATRLGVGLGDSVALGERRFQVRALIRHSPDRGNGPFEFGPRMLIAGDALPATGLIQPGSMAETVYMVRLPEGGDPGAWTADLRRALPDSVGWRVRDARQAAPMVERFVGRLGSFLGLVGLTALLVGGVGVGNAVRTFLEGRVTTIAILKAVGAPTGLVFAVYLSLVGLLALAGSLAGAGLGALAPYALGALAGDWLPLPIVAALFWRPLLLAVVFGLLVALAFSLWPLGRARRIPAASLFRDAVLPGRAGPGAGMLAASIAALAVLALLAWTTAPDRWFAGWFLAGAAGCFGLFRLLASGAILLSRRLGPWLGEADPRLRLALGNLHRPGAPTASVVLSLGLGLTLLVGVALIEGNLGRDITERLPAQAPAFFFLDIQGDQIDGFERIARDTPGVSRVERTPALRGRITRIKGVPVESAPVAPDARWAVDSDRGLTYAALPPPNTKIVAGDWWAADYKGPPLVSFDAKLARGMGVGVGDQLSFNVLGVEVTATIASLRDIDFATLGLNFTVIFAPGFLENAPMSFIAVAYATPEAEAPLLRAETDRYTNISAIRVRDALDSVAGLLGGIGLAARLVAGVTLVTGTLVLIGALIAGQHRRIRDAVVLKVLGATRGDLLLAFCLEYGALGLITAAIAAVLGSLVGWVTVTQVMNAPFVLLPGRIAATSLLCLALTIGLGLAGTWSALGRRAAPVLREP